MIVTIHQPDFFPWLGFFDRWQKSNLYIILDDVQFIRRGWQHRDKIKTQNGVEWLTVPVIKKGQYYQQVRDVRINNNIDWRDRHLTTIQANYKDAPNFEPLFHKITIIYDKNYSLLIDFNIDILHLIASALGIQTPTVFASDFNINTSSSQKLVDLVKQVGGTHYMTGLGAQEYLTESLFIRENIPVIWQQFVHPVYTQLYGAFIPLLSSLDFLMMRTEHTVASIPK